MASGRNPFGANGRPAYYDRDPANELARYADTLDPRTRKASGIVVILGQTPDQDRAYILPLSSEFPDPANELARYADTLDPRTRKASGIVVILGQTPDQDRAYRVEPHTFSALSDATSSLDRFTFDIGGNSLGSMQV